MNKKDYYHLVIYGDSITKGITFDEQSNKYVVLQENFGGLLQKEFNGVIHTVGKFGNTIIRAAKKLNRQVIQKNPDIVILEFGGNDCDFNWEEIAKNPFKDYSPNTDINMFKDHLKKTIKTLRANNIVPVFMSLPPLDAERYLKWVSKNNPCDEKNILKWLETVTRIYWWHERYNSAIINIAEETNTKLIDVRGTFLQEKDYRKYICLDGIHPNELGHRLIANKIIEYTKASYDFLIKKISD
ncbi:MAG: SGNH/GDSL hydrolase family protein [Halanaerobiales bacterium]|nr:SGNH/GDSL hydrolase family protein [Halanaerobiales bacterium]